MLAWVKKVGEFGEAKEIGKGLGAMQKIVGGSIELVRLPCQIDLWVNEEGLFVENPKLNMQTTFYGKVQHNIVGDVLFCGHDNEGNSIDLTPRQIAWLQTNMEVRGYALDAESGKMYEVHTIAL